MRYAITCDNEEVFQHFGKCPSFLIIDVEEDIITKRNMLEVQGSGHGVLVSLLSNAGVTTLICGGIGQGARDALTSAHIALIAGAQGNVETVINALLEGTLKDQPRGQCNHHHGHDCASHE